MKVSELIEILETCNPDAKVAYAENCDSLMPYDEGFYMEITNVIERKITKRAGCICGNRVFFANGPADGDRPGAQGYSSQR